jgi:hypothetical protein
MKTTVLYKFIVHPQDIFEQTPKYIDAYKKNLRVHIIQNIARNFTSDKFKSLDEALEYQKKFDEEIFWHYKKENGNVIGMCNDLVKCLEFDNTTSLISLSKLDLKAWTEMNVKHLI